MRIATGLINMWSSKNELFITAIMSDILMIFQILEQKNIKKTIKF